MAGEFLRVVFLVGRKSDAKFLVYPGHGIDRSMQHDGQPGTVQDGEDFLGFSQRVAEQDGRLAVLQRLGAELQDIGNDLLGGGKPVMRQPVGRLHHESVGAGGLEDFRRQTLAELEVARVKQRALVVLVKKLGGAQDMAGRIERRGPGAEVALFAERQDVQLSDIPAHAGLHQAGGGSGAEQVVMAARVVAMGVRNEGPVARNPRVQPEIGGRKVQALAVFYGNHGSEGGSPLTPPRG